MAMLSISSDATDWMDLPDPSDFSITRADLSKAERTADGNMEMQYIATKTKVIAKWNVINDDVLKTILDKLQSIKTVGEEPFFYLKFPDAGGDRIIYCYHGDVKYSLHSLSPKRWNLAIDFIER